MPSRNICTRIGSIFGYYIAGIKYCGRCEVYLFHEGYACLCCKCPLRTSPNNRRGKEKLRTLPLDDAIGLDAQDNQYQYPQIVFIPDDPKFCRIYNGGQPKVDCSPTTARLVEFRHNSENILNTLRQIPAPWGALSVRF